MATLLERFGRGRQAVANYDAAVVSMVRRSLERAEAEQDAGWRDIQQRLHALYDGDFAAIVSDHVSRFYPRVAAEWNDQRQGHLYFPILEQMARTLAVVFHRPPETWLERDGERVPDDDPEARQWKRDRDDLGWASLLRTIDQWVVLFRSVLVQPSAVRSRVRWQVHAPYAVRVDQDPSDPGEIDAAPGIHVELPVPHGPVNLLQPEGWTRLLRPLSGRSAAPSVWVSWLYDEPSATRAMVVHESGTPLPNPLFADGVNRYGRNPFILWRDHQPPAGELWLPAREDWYRLGLWCCTHLMDVAHTLRYQAFSVPVLKGWPSDEQPTIGPGRPLVFPGDDPAAGLQFVTPQPAIEQQIGALNAFLRAFAVAEGLPPDTWEANSSTRNLGAKKMEAHALSLRREERMPVYDAALRRTFDVHKTVANVLGEAGARTRYSDNTELGVRFAPVPTPVDELQDAERRRLDFATGVDSPVDYLVRRDGIDRPTAEARLAEAMERMRAMPMVTEAAGMVRPPGEPG